jgi:hypothetical protein
MTDLPASVQIGARRYSISQDADAVRATEHRIQSSGIYGAIDHRDLSIVLAPDQAEGQLRDTLLHEVLHGVMAITGGGVDDEEELVLRITPTLLDTLRRNPELVTYLMDEEN